MANPIALIGPLWDASCFLTLSQASLPTPSHPLAPSIFARASILFAWSGVEAIVLYELRILGVVPRRRHLPLEKDVKLLMAKRHVQFDDVMFRRLRSYRNEIAHPKRTPVYTAPPAEVALEHFDYCVSLCRTLYSHDLLFEVPPITK